jgi:hypothetical protein
LLDGPCLLERPGPDGVEDGPGGGIGRRSI